MPYNFGQPCEEVFDKLTAQEIRDQVWGEFEASRYLINSGSPEIPQEIQTEIASYVEQSECYFNDAFEANWRSAGLLYYYSFMNLGKVVVKSNDIALDVKHAKHGLHFDSDATVKNILDTPVKIYPPGKTQSNVSIFSRLYEAITYEEWPFEEKIDIRLNDVIGYCLEISDETSSLYGVLQKVFYAHSLIRRSFSTSTGLKAFLEVLIPTQYVQVFRDHFPKIGQIVSVDIPIRDPGVVAEWALSHRLTVEQLTHFSMFRMLEAEDNENFNPEGYKKVTRKAFKNLSCPTVYNREITPTWLFVPKISLGGKELFWHPVFSDYIFSFVLGSILRYQPFLLMTEDPDKAKNSFLCRAWCRQSPLNALRYFLMILKKVNGMGVRVNRSH